MVMGPSMLSVIRMTFSMVDLILSLVGSYIFFFFILAGHVPAQNEKKSVTACQTKYQA